MKKKADDTNALLCKIVCALEDLQQQGIRTGVRVHHLIQHVHHIEDLVVEMGGAAMDQEKLHAILNKSAESKQKLSQALEADPPASTQSGDPPQG